MEIIFNDEFKLSDFKMAVMSGFERTLFPPISNKTKTVPGRPGAWDFGVEIGPRIDTFPIICMASDPIEREQLIGEFVSKFFDQVGQPKILKIRTNYNPKVWIECRVSAQASGKFYRGGHADFDLQFTAFSDPFKRAEHTAFDPVTPIYYGEVAPGDYYKNPESFDWTYSRHYYGCYNYGALNTDIIFTITGGSATNPSITHLETGRELTLPSFTNKTVVVDTGRKIITINGEEILSGSNMKFFSLLPGTNGFLFQGETVKGRVSSQWLHRFM